MHTEVLAEEAWNFVVFSHGEDWVLTYVAGNVGLYEVSIRRDADELERIRIAPGYAKSLAERFRHAPEAYRARELRPAISPPPRTPR